MREKTCCFTGHRNIPSGMERKLFRVTEKIVETAIEDGYRYFGAGGALGFDTIAALVVLKLKERYPNIKLILVLPCVTQTKGWRKDDVEIYEDIKRQADKVVYTSQEYTRGCMHKRNRHLVDNSSLCICYQTENKGGTFYTVGRSSKNGPFMGMVSGQRVSGSYDNGRGATTAVLQDDLTVELNMELIKAIYRISDEKYEQKLYELSKTLGLQSFMKYRVDQLSLGQRMRAEIAVVLLYEPELLILDEPFIGVDLIAKESIRQLLQNLSKDKNTTIILTTHNVEEIEKICERVILIDKGKMVFNGSFDRIKYSHASINSLCAELIDKIPDMQDFPVIRYMVQNKKLTVWYDSQIISTKDLTTYILSQCEVKDLIIRKPTIEEIIRQIYEEDIK